MFIVDREDDTLVHRGNSLHLLQTFVSILRAYLQAYIEMPNIPNEATNERYSAPVFNALTELMTYCAHPKRTIRDAPFDAFKLAYENFRDMQRVPKTTYTFGSI